MGIRSLYDVCIRPHYEAPPIHPLSLVPHLSDRPQIILHFDFPNRAHVVTGEHIPRRIEKGHTHVFVTTFHPRLPPETTAFGAFSLNETYKDGELQRAHPQAEAQDKIDHEGMKKAKSDWERLRKKDLWRPVRGEICNEGWRYADAHLIIETDNAGYFRAQRMTEHWRENHHRYSIAGWRAPNCATYALAMERAARGFRGREGQFLLSFLQHAYPWPGVMAKRIVRRSLYEKAVEFSLTHIGNLSTLRPWELPHVRGDEAVAAAGKGIFYVGAEQTKVMLDRALSQRQNSHSVVTMPPRPRIRVPEAAETQLAA